MTVSISSTKPFYALDSGNDREIGEILVFSDWFRNGMHSIGLLRLYVFIFISTARLENGSSSASIPLSSKLVQTFNSFAVSSWNDFRLSFCVSDLRITPFLQGVGHTTKRRRLDPVCDKAHLHCLTSIALWFRLSFLTWSRGFLQVSYFQGTEFYWWRNYGFSNWVWPRLL